MLTLPPSTLGFEVRKTVSDQLQPKRSATLILHHKESPLALHLSLQGQGISGNAATLSCTYVPTDLYAAHYLQGFPVPGECALEGVTQMTGETFEHVGHLPQHLERLAFSSDFNHCLHGVALPSSVLHLTFGREFDKSLSPETLPSNLQSFGFSQGFNRSLDKMTWPCSLRILKCAGPAGTRDDLRGAFPRCASRGGGPTSASTRDRLALSPTNWLGFNQSLDGVTLPSNLDSLTFGGAFNQSLDRVALPHSLQSLTFGRDFDQSMEGVALPDSLFHLGFGTWFNQSLERVTFPDALQSLRFRGFDQNLEADQSLEGVTLPINLQSLVLERDRRDLNPGKSRLNLPCHLQSLTLGVRLHEFPSPLLTLPSTLQTLTLGENFNYPLQGVTLPSNLQSLTFGDCFDPV